MQSSLTLALLLCGLAGQTPSTQETAKPATQEVAPEQKKLDELVVIYKKERAEVTGKRRKGTSDEEYKAALALFESKGFAAQFQALADEQPGTDTAARALLWKLRTGLEREPALATVARLLEQHRESEVLVELVQDLNGIAAVIGEEEVVKTLAELVERSPRKVVQGQALFALGSRQLGSKDTALQAAGRKALERVIADYGDLAARRATLGAQATGILFKLDKLQLGMVAPEMEAVDENGVAWKLSDYRGKVVLVDFWGYW